MHLALYQPDIPQNTGAILRLSAFSAISEQPISAKMAREVLSNIIGRETPRVSIGVIQRVVCDHFEVALSELLSKLRNASIVFPRQVAMYLARTETHASLPQIAAELGGRDHTTVLYGIRKVEGQMEQDSTLRREIGSIQQQLYRRQLAG